jgi:hypothetical protein
LFHQEVIRLELRAPTSDAYLEMIAARGLAHDFVRTHEAIYRAGVGCRIVIRILDFLRIS